ncbi:MHYT domain-containing protein [Stackebrandtia nassauensis]|uniref:Putative integral membrane sensor protein n=1 Tax=Stackebrandtia nassauensis (strain DSM 44728 / CIP 108903 / NRRL B-16338 / NBRC 102104 / LLR-40K-21) TaxID=446470 RepID=D3QC18_STANL|nr:MHYT domain-containing protein [Stackebrandtia nassauensis]ADD44907.1 putative integral membrane sensor protein [Stackebrandtia nassauensis DSM 44728]
MTHDHFAYGPINPIMGFGFALAGAFLGLTCMLHARRLPSGRGRIKWLAFASLAIGGTGIWMMHFIAMIGFSVPDGEVRYDIPITAASLVISIVSVAFGIFTVGLGKSSITKILIGGPLTGMGVVAMHYTGMAAVNLPGTIHYDPMWVAGSIAIAVVAATVALFFTTWVSGKGSLIGASIIMGIAVTGMHYTGMRSISVAIDDDILEVPGVDPLVLLIPILILATIVLIGLIVGVLGERDDMDELPERIVEAIERRRELTEETEAAQAADAATPSFWDPEPQPAAAEPAAVGQGRGGPTRFDAQAFGNRRLPQPRSNETAAPLWDTAEIEAGDPAPRR